MLERVVDIPWTCGAEEDMKALEDTNDLNELTTKQDPSNLRKLWQLFANGADLDNVLFQGWDRGECL
jgi:hypothetical protein